MNCPLRMMALMSAVSALFGTMISSAAESLPSVPPAPAAVDQSSVGAHRLVGVAGCTAASCHGGRSLIGGEGSAWLARDVKHRQAYDVLFNDVSVAMVAKLNLKPAHTEARCLACHSSEVALSNTPHGDRFAVEYGVGCESCHGAAGDWLAKHTTRTWKSLTTVQKSEFGFRDLRSPTAQAKSCVACHVGSPAATVDHDLIAAGHPRLAFEFSAYYALLPKHWDSAPSVARDPGQEVRHWIIGQAATTIAMSDIAASRAEAALKAKAKHVLPDLAEFDCNACHHDLAEPPRGRPTLRSPLGTPRWGSWAIPSARFLTRESLHVLGTDGTSAEAALSEMTALMQRSRLGLIPADELSKSARQSSDRLAAWLVALESSRCDAAQTKQLLQRVISPATDADWSPTWDGQAQRYLAIVAVNQSLYRLTGHAPRATVDTHALSGLRQRLQFPVGYSTPRHFDPSDVESLIRELQKNAAQ